MRAFTSTLAVLLIASACTGESQHASGERAGTSAGDGARTDTYGDRLGTVQFATSCDPEASLQVQRGVALVHSMTYEDAEVAFAAATETDPECALGYWGQALTFVHPLWSDPPNEATFERGRALLETARTRGTTTEREAAYIEALEPYYAAGWSHDERPNLEAFERGWEAFHRRFPDDPEGASFYALAQLSTADPGDKTYAKQRRAGQLAEEVLARIPDHPGAQHYIIHAYDNPRLSEQALSVARSYGGVAPELPHALHMPTHTFTRLGLWQESIDWNRRSADAALKHPVGDSISAQYFHALDYLAYAYLQGAEDRRAEKVLREMEAAKPPFQVEIATPYAMAAVPARLALERRRWTEAAHLEPRRPASYPWETAPALEAITHFARALGAARSGSPSIARSALKRLAELRDRAAVSGPYWGRQVEIQRLSALAWLEYAEGDRAGALATMRSATELEASTEKHPVTPGEVLPARELLGDMLLELNRPAEALAEYERALSRSPNRFNSLFGAARAAELSGDLANAADFYNRLLEVTEHADTERAEMKQARDFLAARAT